MLGVLLAFILIAVLRNGMQLANLGGPPQDIVIGVLLLGAILAGNLCEPCRRVDCRSGSVRRLRKEVNHTESGVQVSVDSNS